MNDKKKTLGEHYASKQVQPLERCGNCRFRHEERCRKNPPQVQPLGAKQGLAGELVPVTMSSFPHVPEDQWCGQWETTIEA